MNKSTKILRMMFSGVNTQYLIKSYFFSIIITFLIFYMGTQEGALTLSFLYFVFCGLLFPFATIVWDDLVNTIMGGHFLILPLPFMLMWKFFKLTVLYMFTPLIAPIGFVYIYIANGYHKKGA